MLKVRTAGAAVGISTVLAMAAIAGSTGAAQAAAPAPAARVTVASGPSADSASQFYRLYDPRTGDRLYTASAGEAGNLVRAGWQQDPSPGSVDTRYESGTIPLYRLRHDKYGHFYTSNAEEALNATRDSGYHYESVAGYIWPAGTAGTVPLYRLVNNTDGHRLYTASKAEADNAVAIFNYHYEPSPGNVLPLT